VAVCEHDNIFSDSINPGKFLDQLNDYWPLKNDCSLNQIFYIKSEVSRVAKIRLLSCDDLAQIQHTVTCTRFIVTNNNVFWVWWLGLLDASTTNTLDCNSSHIEILLDDFMKKPYEKSFTALSLISHCCLISLHESAAFCNFHEARIEDTTLNTSPVVLLVVARILCLPTCYVVTTLSLLFFVAGT
jgi:hypothetical protein